MNEFATRVNESISNLCAERDHANGERAIVYIPVPAGVDPDLDKAERLIDLDDVETEKVEDGKVRAPDGSIQFDAAKTGATLYRVTGGVRK